MTPPSPVTGTASLSLPKLQSPMFFLHKSRTANASDLTLFCWIASQQWISSLIHLSLTIFARRQPPSMFTATKVPFILLKWLTLATPRSTLMPVALPTSFHFTGLARSFVLHTTALTAVAYFKCTRTGALSNSILLKRDSMPST